MNLPFFYTEGTAQGNGILTLDEDSSRHIAQVLRMKPGEQLRLTDGKGTIYTAAIESAHKKATTVSIQSTEFIEPKENKTTIGISLIKNAGRFEWFLEKATELGIYAIQPLITERTEKEHFRYERMKHILVSAMLQSRQAWLPVFNQPISFQKFLEGTDVPVKMIAHCLESNKETLAAHAKSDNDSVILIGPEGDFTGAEVEAAISKGYIPVSLGNTRLRTETAAVAAAVMLQLS